MNFKLPLSAAFVAILGLSACGGAPEPARVAAASNPANFTTIVHALGAGAEAAPGKTVRVHYTGWLYDAAAPDFKGRQFDSSSGRGPYEFTLYANQVIEGFDMGVRGMKVGAKRTLLIPSPLGYGAAGSPGIPPNAGLVYDVELVAVL